MAKKKANGVEISILNGETANGETSFFFSAKEEYIVLGRDPNTCHVVFSETTLESGIGNEHLGLRRSLGRYQLDLNNDHFVSVDGDAPYEDQEIAKSAELTLGSGIRIRVEVIDHRKQAPASSHSHLHPGEVAKRNRRTGFVLATVLIAVMVFGYFIFRDVTETEHEMARVLEAIDQIETGDDRISTTVIDEVMKSVYVVLLQNEVGGEQLHGTAWVTENGQLATNAHLAEIFNSKKLNARVLVRSSTSPYQTHEVTGVTLHPGYDVFTKLWREHLPVQKGLNALDLMRTISPADVALMEVTNAEALAAPLKLASNAQLAGLRTGAPVAFVGYPAEKLLPGTLKEPIPVAQQDELVRLTDFFMVDRQDGNNRLIQHGLPLIGGASGSPIFIKDGTVIGVISSVNIASVLGGRIANPADINFAQRIDFLKDLNVSEGEVNILEYVKQWNESLAQFSRGVDASLQAVNESAVTVFSPAMLPQTTSISSSVQNVDPTLKRVGEVQQISLPYAGLHLITVASNTYRFKLSVRQKKRRFPVYRYQIPYSNLINYYFVITDQTEDLDLKIETMYKKDLEESKPYVLNIQSWPLSPDVVREQMAIHNSKLQISTKAQPKLLREIAGLSIDQQSDGKKGYFQGQSLEFDLPGYYLLFAISDASNPVQNLLVEDLGFLKDKPSQQFKKDSIRVVKKGHARQRETYLFYHHKGTAKKLSYIFKSKVAVKDMKIRVYYWPEEKE